MTTTHDMDAKRDDEAPGRIWAVGGTSMLRQKGWSAEKATGQWWAQKAVPAAQAYLRLTINGRLASGVFMDRLQSCTVTDREGATADEVTLTLNDDPPGDIPPRDAVISVEMGYAGALAFMGEFIAQEMTLAVKPYTMTVTGKSATFGKVASQKERHWDDISIADLVTQIAGENGLSASVDPVIGAFVYPWIGQIDESDAAFLERLAGRHGAIFSIKRQTVIELIQDSAIDIEAFIRGRLVTRLGRITNRHFVIGTGTAQPRGIQVAASVGHTAKTGLTTSVDYDTLVKVQHSVDPAYRNGKSGWLFNDNTLAEVRTIKDASGRPIFVPGYDQNVPGGAPDTLLGNSLSKISEIADLAPRDVYRKLDFIYERVREFTTRREGDLRSADWERYGRRFATDSQTLTLNWPNRKKRASVAVQHLCTAHANSGYIVLGHLQFDPAGDMEQVEIDMALNGDIKKARCMRRHGRLWTAAEFKKYLDDITAKVVLDPEIAADVDLGLQLPHEGGLVRQDIQQYAHALMLRRMVSQSKSRFYFVQDGDAGLGKAFLAGFAPEVQAGRVDVATVAFDKYQVNDVREALWAQGRRDLRTDLGLTAHQIDCLPEKIFNEEVDREIVKRLAGHRLGTPFAWPYHTKSEPSRIVDLKTDRFDLSTERCARLMRLATLRSVDSYFHKIRSNVRPASRPVSTPSNNGRTWDRHFLYRPEMLVKIIEIYRFHHNWMGTRQTKQTPAMKLGLAKGRIYERDLFGE